MSVPHSATVRLCQYRTALTVCLYQYRKPHTVCRCQLRPKDSACAGPHRGSSIADRGSAFHSSSVTERIDLLSMKR
eukprot:1403554-Rhodomonas_salina.1